jgi:hypothetical protein
MSSAKNEAAAEIWKSMKPISTFPPHDGYDEMI